MPLRSTNTTLRTFDGLHLAGTLVTPDAEPDRAVVFVHGGGVTREEGGYFTRLATGLGEAAVASLRYDLRGHGEEQGQMQGNNPVGSIWTTSGDGTCTARPM